MCASSAAVGRPPSIRPRSGLMPRQGGQPAGTRRRGRLHHRGLTGAAAIFRPADAFDPDDRRHDVQHLTDVLADPMQFTLTAGAGVARGLDDHVLTRQVVRKAADVARRFRACRFRPVRLPVRPGVRRGLDGKCRQITEAERQLRFFDIALFRTSSIQCPLQRLQHRTEFVVLGTQSGDHLDQDVGIARQGRDGKCHARILTIVPPTLS
jgi:hypothetical protein